MKKLIVFAAVAALGLSAMAKDLCTDDPEDSCAFWDVKVTLKTLVTDKKMAAIKDKDPCSDSCSDSCYMLKDTTVKLKGGIWMCDVACLDKTGTEDGFILWDTTNKKPVSKPLVWDGSKYSADSLTFDILDRYTKKANKVEAFWTKAFEEVTTTNGKTTKSYPAFGTIWAAGTKGSITKKNDEVLLKSISGNAVGKLDPSAVVSSQCSDTTIKGKVLGMCDCVDGGNICSAGEEATEVAASGTWSIKYNKSLSKGTKSLSKIVPSYAQSDE